MRLRLEPRTQVSRSLSVATTLGALVFALVLSGLILALVGGDPIRSYLHILNAAFGSIGVLSDTLVKATPLTDTFAQEAHALGAGAARAAARSDRVRLAEALITSARVQVADLTLRAEADVVAPRVDRARRGLRSWFSSTGRCGATGGMLSSSCRRTSRGRR